MGNSSSPSPRSLSSSPGLSIVLDSLGESNGYRPGETISGSALLNFPRPVKVLSVQLRLSGLEHCTFFETMTMKMGYSYSYRKYLTNGHRVIFNTSYVPLHKFDLTATAAMTGLQGKHEFPFSITLPNVVTLTDPPIQCFVGRIFQAAH